MNQPTTKQVNAFETIVKDLLNDCPTIYAFCTQLSEESRTQKCPDTFRLYHLSDLFDKAIKRKISDRY